jgi:hypothetical protein
VGGGAAHFMFRGHGNRMFRYASNLPSRHDLHV